MLQILIPKLNSGNFFSTWLKKYKKYILRSTGIPTYQRNGRKVLPEKLGGKSDLCRRNYILK